MSIQVSLLILVTALLVLITAQLRAIAVMIRETLDAVDVPAQSQFESTEASDDFYTDTSAHSPHLTLVK
jgi:hypothetical protein